MLKIHTRTNWQDEIRPGDIVMFKLPTENPTFFGKLVAGFQNLVTVRDNTKTHAAIALGPSGTQPKPGETQLLIIDVEFGRRIKPYLMPRDSEVDIYRPFSQDLFLVHASGSTNIATAKQIADRATALALLFTGATYSVEKCLGALATHKIGREHSINEDYVQWLHTIIPYNSDSLQIRENLKDSSFMCVFLILYCYQKACLEILGGIPKPFQIHALSSPRYLDNWLRTSGHFTQIAPEIVTAILASGTPKNTRPNPREMHYPEESPPTRPLFSFIWARRQGYQALVADYPRHDPLQKNEEEQDEGKGLGLTIA